MKYRGSPAFSHRQADKIGVLVTNLGTPEAPDKESAKALLKSFCLTLGWLKYHGCFGR